jgi:hypothetical protein
MAKAQTKVMVLLSDACIECLKANARDAPECMACLEGAIDVRRVFVGNRFAYRIECTEEEVRQLLDIATRHCPDAVAAIKDSLARFTGRP